MEEERLGRFDLRCYKLYEYNILSLTSYLVLMLPRGWGSGLVKLDTDPPANNPMLFIGTTSPYRVENQLTLITRQA